MCYPNDSIYNTEAVARLSSINSDIQANPIQCYSNTKFSYCNLENCYHFLSCMGTYSVTVISFWKKLGYPTED